MPNVTVYFSQPITSTIQRRDRGAQEVAGPVWAVRATREQNQYREARWTATAVLLEQPEYVRAREPEAVGNVLEVEPGTMLAIVWPAGTLDSYNYATLFWFSEFGVLPRSFYPNHQHWFSRRPTPAEIDASPNAIYGGWQYQMKFFDDVRTTQAILRDLYATIRGETPFGEELGRLIGASIGEAQRQAAAAAAEGSGPFEGQTFDFDYRWNAGDAQWHLGDGAVPDVQPPPPDDDIHQPTKANAWLPFVFAAGAVLAVTRKRR